MVRVALADDTSRDDVDDVACSLGLCLLNIVARTEAHPAQLVFVSPAPIALVHFVDAGPGTRAWVVRAEGGVEIEERWAEALRSAGGGGA